MKKFEALLFFALLLLGCSGGNGNSGGTPQSTANPTVVSVSLSPSGALSLATGATQQLTATAGYLDGSTKDVTASASWSSSSGSVASVSTGGLVTAISAGASNISATVSSVSAAAPLTVTPVLKSITTAPSAPSILVGGTQQFSAAANYSDGSTKDVSGTASWASANTAVATISASGLATAISAGTTSISATISGISGSASLTVTRPLESVGVTVTGLTGAGLALQLNGSGNLSITANGSATFPTQLPSGASYVVTVLTQPTSTSQICTVTNGSGAIGSSNVTNIQVACALDLTTTTTLPVIDSGLPMQVSQSISQVISSADSEALGSMLTIPTNSAGFETPIFAVDSNQNPILIAYTNGPQTTLSADSTAAALVLQTVGVVPSDVATFAQLVGDVKSASGYGSLLAALNSSFSAGTPPLQAEAVAQNVAIVVNQVLVSISSQTSSSSVSITARARPPTVLPQETATPPLPFQVFGSSASKTILSLYISSVSANQGVNLINQMPIKFHASSADESNTPLDMGESLPAASLWLGQVITPAPVAVSGNGNQFVLNVDEIDPATQQANLTQSINDWIVLLLNTAMGMAAKGQQIPGVEQCAQQGAQAIIAGLGSTWNTILVTSATGAQLSTSLAASLPATTLYQGIKIAVGCAAQGGLTSSGAQALANLASFLLPSSAVWKGIQFTVAAAGPSTEAALTFYYWNKSQPVAVCESNGSIVSCASQLISVYGFLFFANGVGPLQLTVNGQALGNYANTDAGDPFQICDVPVGLELDFTFSTTGMADLTFQLENVSSTTISTLIEPPSPSLIANSGTFAVTATCVASQACYIMPPTYYTYVPCSIYLQPNAVTARKTP